MATAMVLSGTLGYFVLETGQPAHQVVFYRCLLGAVFIGLVGVIFRLFPYLALTWKSFMLCGLCGFAIVANWVLLFSAYRFSTISIATAVYHTQPFFLLLIGAVVCRKALSLGKMLWIFLAFIGVVLTVDLTGDHFSLSSSHTIGLIFALAAALLYAAVTMISKRLKKIGPYFVAFLQLSVGAIVLWPFMDHGQFDNITALQWRYLILIGAIHTCFKYMLMYSAWQKLKTPMIAVMAFIYPAVAILVDYLAYGQVLSLTQSIGIGLIVIAGYAVSMNHPFPFTPKKKIRLRKKKKNPQKVKTF